MSMDGIIAGRQPVIEALRAGAKIERIVFLLGAQGRAITDIRLLAEKNGVPVLQVSKQEFRELAVNATTQGVVAVVPTKEFVGVNRIAEIARERNEKGFVLVLDEIEDPHNLGALVRTAECTGVHGVIIAKHRSAPVTTTAVKSSAGATEHMAMAEVTNVVSTIEELKKEGYWIAGLDAGGDRLYTSIDYKGPIAIVVGNEGKGIRRLVKEHCDYLVRIPLYGKIASLNASVAGALVMYEVTRQRRIGA
jgi:23S rRNA (guanosine2251-2'-O)-methyltransferase